MDEKLVKKVKKLLSKNGVSEEKINSILDELENANDEEVAVEEPTQAEEVVDNNENAEPTQANEVPNEANGDLGQEPTEPQADDVAIENAPVDEAVGENVPVEPNGEVPNVEEPQPQDQLGQEPQQPVLPQPNEEVMELRTQNEELMKSVEGLKSRIDSLEEALKQSGVMKVEDENGDVGIDKPRVPNGNTMDDPMDDVLRYMNRGSY